MSLRKFLAASLLWAAGFSAALAVDLDTAKMQGLVGETPDGYIAAVQPSASTDVLELVRDINAKRKQVYQQIAERNKADVRSVETLAGAKAIQRTPSGQYVYLDGKWVRK